MSSPSLDVEDPRMTKQTPYTDPGLDYLYGRDNTEGVVGMTPLFETDQLYMRLYVRDGDGVRFEDREFHPFFFCTEEAAKEITTDRDEYYFKRLEGDNEYGCLVATDTWSTYTQILDTLYVRLGYEVPEADDDGEIDYDYRKIEEVNKPGNLSTLFLMQSGVTFFGGMTLQDIHRLQLDIEVYSSTDSFPSHEREGDEVIIVTLSDNRGREIIITQDRPQVTRQQIKDESGASRVEIVGSETALLEKTRDLVVEIDPDTIEGHNVLDFDLRYLIGRCELHGVSFAIGRDGSEPFTWESSRTFAEKDLDYLMVSVPGRSVIDTLFLALDYDVFAREMESHDLKYTARHFGVAAGSGDASDRTYVEGDEIDTYWDEDPLPLLAYALDDVRETRAVAEILSESAFYLSHILPMSYQDAERKGTATVIEALMTREYLRQRISVPAPDSGASQSSGGYTDIYMRGVYDRVIYADVSSLYPSIMVEYECNPGEKDPVGLFDRMLGQLLDMRLEIKTEMRDLKSKLEDGGDLGQETRADLKDRVDLLDAKQSSYKILINSFYGAMGFAFFAWNHIEEADRVAETGQALLKKMIQEIEKDGGRIVEVDTDGVIFTPLDEEGRDQMEIDRTDKAEAEYVRSLTERMPEGIEIDHDGSFERVISLKKKNYALKKWGQDPENMKVKGSSLISRSNEKFGRDFVQDVLEALMRKNVEAIHEIYLKYHERIVTSDWTAQEFTKTESLKETFGEYQENVALFEQKGHGHGHPKYARYEVAMRDERRGDSEYAVGDEVSFYVAQGPEESVAERAKHVRRYDPENPDEDTEYYLERLQRFSEKFEAFFAGPDWRQLFSPDNGLFGVDASTIEIQNSRAREPLVESERVTVPTKPKNKSLVGRPTPANVFEDEYDVYCGRNDDGEVAPTPGDPGWLGNPIKRGEECPVCGDHHEEEGSTLPCYEKYLRKRLKEDRNFREAFMEAIDETTRLGCFCVPNPCHTEVIADVWQEIVELSVQD